uniref:Ig-like domain-containing protein n=1 Tax=Gopherus agassizii TaxID=38772 RepID=A0A452H684_9SAUR
MPLYSESRQGTLQRKLEASARLQTYALRLPTTARQTASVSVETTTSADSKTFSHVKSILPTTKTRTSSKVLRGKIPWQHLFGKVHIQKELLKKLSRQRTRTVPSSTITSMLPKTTATLSIDRVSPFHLTTISVEVNQTDDLLSLTKPISHDNSMSEKQSPIPSLTTAELLPSAYFSNLPNAINKEMNATRPMPTFRSTTVPHTEAKITKIKAFRAGRRRDQRRKNKQASVQPDGTLVIKEVTVYDRGLYTCMASNPAGADTLTVKLQVIVAPPVILEEKRQHIAGIMGESLKLPCTAKGNPHPSPLHFVNAKLFLFSNGTLYIRNIAPSDSGNYECIATSSTGSERRVVNLTVDPTVRGCSPAKSVKPNLFMQWLNLGHFILF